MADPEQVVASLASVVTLGAFNPTIFQPSWLKANRVIGPDDQADLNVDEDSLLVFRDLAVINLPELGLDISVGRDRFSVLAKQDPHVLAKDVALNCLRLLPHTPVKALGINHTLIFNSPDTDSYHRFGDTLAPKGPWQALLGEGDTRTGGLRAMTMERLERADGRPGYLKVLLSVPEGGAHTTTKIEVNDHLELRGTDGELVPASKACELLEEVWDASIATAQKILTSLVELANVRTA